MIVSRRMKSTATPTRKDLHVFGFSIAFLVGCFVGNLVSLNSWQQQVPFEVSRCPDSTTQITAPMTTRASTHPRGWMSIDVFYGDSKHLNDTLDRDRVWFSQAHQDQAINALFRGKKNGFFVDLAANDATTLSNTYSLEQQLGWTGLCIEPNPIYWSNLTYRDCKVIAAVVGKERMQEIRFRFDAGDHGGIAGDGFDNGPRFKASSTPRYTVTLLEIFQRYNVPNHIDYLSLDVEGAEEFIMSTFPLDKYTISVLTVERPTAGLRDIFAKHGYERIMRLSRWGETLWAHESMIPSLDIEAVKAFDPKTLKEQGLE